MQIYDMFVKFPQLPSKETTRAAAKRLSNEGDLAAGAVVNSEPFPMKRVSIQKYMAVQEMKQAVSGTSWLSMSPWSGLAELWWEKVCRGLIHYVG
jgi:hypothetical protein